MSPAAKPSMQRTISTPAQPQELSSWRPDLPEDSAPSPSPPPYPHPAHGFPRPPQGVDLQPLPCSSPPVHGIPARQPCYPTTGTDPVRQYTPHHTTPCHTTPHHTTPHHTTPHIHTACFTTESHAVQLRVNVKTVPCPKAAAVLHPC